MRGYLDGGEAPEGAAEVVAGPRQPTVEVLLDLVILQLLGGGGRGSGGSGVGASFRSELGGACRGNTRLNTKSLGMWEQAGVMGMNR